MSLTTKEKRPCSKLEENVEIAVKKAKLDQRETKEEKKKVEVKKAVVKKVVEEEQEEFYFDFEDQEFLDVVNVARQWSKKNKIGHISNGTEGDYVSEKLRTYVEKEHTDLAKRVEKDATIYEAVLMQLNDDGELDLSSESSESSVSSDIKEKSVETKTK